MKKISKQRRWAIKRQEMGLCPTCGRLPELKDRKTGERYFRCKDCREVRKGGQRVHFVKNVRLKP